MLVKDAINQLLQLNGDDPIVFAFWKSDLFDIPKGADVEAAMEAAEDMDWSYTHEQLQGVIDANFGDEA